MLFVHRPKSCPTAMHYCKPTPLQPCIKPAISSCTVESRCRSDNAPLRRDHSFITQFVKSFIDSYLYCFIEYEFLKIVSKTFESLVASF